MVSNKSSSLREYLVILRKEYPVSNREELAQAQRDVLVDLSLPYSRRDIIITYQEDDGMTCTSYFKKIKTW